MNNFTTKCTYNNGHLAHSQSLALCTSKVLYPSTICTKKYAIILKIMYRYGCVLKRGVNEIRFLTEMYILE